MATLTKEWECINLILTLAVVVSNTLIQKHDNNFSNSSGNMSSPCVNRMCVISKMVFSMKLGVTVVSEECIREPVLDMVLDI